MSEPILAIRDLVVEFRGRTGASATAVDSVSIDVGEGEIVALVGESGSGKSVTAMSVLGLLPDNADVAGSISLRGTELVGVEAKKLESIRGQRVAMVFQDPFGALDPVFTVGFQIREILRRHFPQLTAAARKERTLELLRAVELRDPEKRVSAYPHQLSGGQAQRVVLAMALACEPEVLIADEPTTALDVTVQREILDLLVRVRSTTAAAMLIITHDMGVVADVADRVVVMRRGRIVETRPVEELFSNPEADYTKQLLGSVPRLDVVERPERDESESALVVDDLTVDDRRRFHSVRAVTQASLTIGRGETLALVGESGSGKSTTGKSIVGLAPVSRGRIFVDGIDSGAVRGAERTALRRRIGVVFQNPMGALDPRWTMGEVIGEPLRVHAGLRGAALEKKVHELLDAVDLDWTWGSRYAHELSGGQRQRIAIARAVALDPVLLIADEPTSALDVSVQATILDLFRRLQAELRFACLFISHDLAVVDSLADRVVVMRNSRIVEEGPRREVLLRPREDYTRALLESVPIADPGIQKTRRRERETQ